jgi:hypothetical protein|tara:strand:- start:656 stop:793 length:138 start_codon:yes stop_codon:yes gene_type:complete
MDCLGESSVLPISTHERTVAQTTRARALLPTEIEGAFQVKFARKK